MPRCGMTRSDFTFPPPVPVESPANLAWDRAGDGPGAVRHGAHAGVPLPVQALGRQKPAGAVPALPDWYTLHPRAARRGILFPADGIVLRPSVGGGALVIATLIEGGWEIFEEYAVHHQPVPHHHHLATTTTGDNSSSARSATSLPMIVEFPDLRAPARVGHRVFLFPGASEVLPFIVPCCCATTPLLNITGAGSTPLEWIVARSRRRAGSARRITPRSDVLCPREDGRGTMRAAFHAASWDPRAMCRASARSKPPHPARAKCACVYAAHFGRRTSSDVKKSRASQTGFPESDPRTAMVPA